MTGAAVESGVDPAKGAALPRGAVPEVTVASLDVRQQKWLENAHLALERGQIDYVLDVCGSILKTAPGCLAVRRLQRRAQLHRFQNGNRLRRLIAGALTGRFARRTSSDAAESFARAEELLARNPTSVSALRLLADAAGRLGLPETAAFALGAIGELEPENRVNMLALGEAWLVAGQPAKALRVAELLLAAWPADPAGLGLQRKASVAQTIAQGKWESAASFREKIRP